MPAADWRVDAPGTGLSIWAVQWRRTTEEVLPDGLGAESGEIQAPAPKPTVSSEMAPSPAKPSAPLGNAMASTLPSQHAVTPMPPGKPVPIPDLTTLLSRLAQPEGEATWVYVVIEDRIAAYASLVSRFGFHPLLVEDAMDEGDRPILKFQNGWGFLTIPFINRDDPERRFREVGAFVSGGVLFTVVTQHDPDVSRLFEMAATETPPELDSGTALLYRVLDLAVDGYYPVTDDVEDQVDELESRVLSGLSIRFTEALSLKRELLEIRRRISPLRDIVNELLRQGPSLVPPVVLPYLQDVYDHSLRVMERVDLNRDLIATVVDAHLNMTSNALNQTMRTLTIISTSLMTSALVAGVYGMNFKYMPELEWWWGYPMAVLIMITLTAAEVWYFKRRGWL